MLLPGVHSVEQPGLEFSPELMQGGGGSEVQGEVIPGLRHQVGEGVSATGATADLGGVYEEEGGES